MKSFSLLIAISLSVCFSQLSVQALDSAKIFSDLDKDIQDHKFENEHNEKTIKNLKSLEKENKLEEMFASEIKKVIEKGSSGNRFSHLFEGISPENFNLNDLNSLELNFTTPKTHHSLSKREARSNAMTMMPRNHNALLTSANARTIDAMAGVGMRVSQNLMAHARVNKADKARLLANVQVPSSFCPFKSVQNCDPTERFSRLDGSCNNLAKPWLGKAETPYKRYLPPAYDDGLNSPRSTSVTGQPLENPRVISRTLFNDNHRQSNFYTHLIAPIGQFLAHDISSASVTSDGSAIVDCPCNSANPACMSVVMPSNENIMRMTCMKFTRSSAAFASFDCSLGHREQLNLLTSFIDLTVIYGPSDSRSRELRAFQGGQLKTSPGVNGKPFLPRANDLSCTDTDATRQCFAGGEGRTNENLGLLSIETTFVREHNRIANELSMINPHWSDERLFQEARKILIGIWQNIIYSEYVPAIVGFNTAALFDLMPRSSNEYFNGYDPNVNPQLAGEFTTAAFRFGHTLMKNQLKRFNSQNQEMAAPVQLSSIIFRPVEAYNAAAGGVESILIGLVNEPAENFDTSYVDTLQNHLFEFRLSDGSVIAIDLAATNINRGRDHGIPSYNAIRQKCGFAKAKTFQDLADFIPANELQRLASVYKHVDDIDYYVGGLTENPAKGALVGPTFACILANQFKDLKKGDRFYYENGPSPTAFTLDQLREIKKSTMSKVICNNYDLKNIQINAFLQPLSSINNGRVPCSSILSYDLRKWKSSN